MSGPKGLGYRIIDPVISERQRLAAAERRWRALRGRADVLAVRCRSAGHPECAVRISGNPASESEVLESQCAELEQQINAAVNRLERSQFDDRAKEISSHMKDVLDDLEKRESAAAADAHRSDASLPREPAGRDYADKVKRELASLRLASPELEAAAKSVLEAIDPARARLLYRELAQRVADANQRADMVDRRRSEIAELREQLDFIPEPAVVQALLDDATVTLESGVDPGQLVDQARAAVAEQAERSAARSDQEFVRRAVIESFADIGCDAIDVELETPETLVFRQSGSHGVRVAITAGNIDLRTVRLDPAAGTATDRDADDRLCQTLEEFNGAMRRRGVEIVVREKKLPGTVTPQTVKVSGRSAASVKAGGLRKAKPAGRDRGA